MSASSQIDAIVTSVDDPLERLLSFEATTFPVITLYLNTQPKQNGQPDFHQFTSKRTQRPRPYFPGRIF